MTAAESADLGRFLTVAETAEVLHVSVAQAYALVRSGELPAIRIGTARHWRVERSELEAYIQARYEEERRVANWRQSEYAIVPELRTGPLL
ncbi:helix-turn-helix domain-containing protein [Amnibacterium kyonggiense]